MRNQFLLAFFFLISFRGAAQNTDSIIYVLHFDSVETSIDKYLNSLEKEQRQISYYGFLRRFEGNFSLTICHDAFEKDSSNNFLKNLVNNSNRFLLINKRKIPLIFDYDSFFSTPNSTTIGSIGNRDGNVLRSKFIFHCYTITFNGMGQVLEIESGN